MRKSASWESFEHRSSRERAMPATEFAMKFRRSMTAGAVIVGLVIGGVAQAELTWHPDFTAARTAALESRRPIFVVFVEDLTAGDPLAGTSLDDPAADAVLGACFETVVLDRASSPELARKLVVSREPMIYVFTHGVGTRLVTAFPPPETTPEFVAAAARAAQEATTLSHLAHKAQKPGGLRIGVGSGDEEPQGSGTTVSDSSVSRKFRRLTEFAGDPPTAGDDEWLAEEARTPLTTETAVTTTGPAAENDIGSEARSERGAVVANVEPEPKPEPVAAPDPLPESRREVVQPSVPINPEAPWAAFLDPETAMQPVQPPAEQLSAMESPWQAATAAGRPGEAPAAFGAADAAPLPQANTLPATESTAATTATEPKPAESFQTQFVEALQKPFTFWRRPKPEVAATPQPETPAVTPPPATPKLAAAWPLPWGRMPGIGEQAAKTQPPSDAAADPAAGTPSTSARAAAPVIQARASYDPGAPMPLGMEGYCPVTLVEKGAWTEGRAQWGARHRGRTYLFAGESEQRAFLADPDRYAPALSGDDPVLAFESGTSTPGQRRYGVTYQSRMYLFSSPETRAAFAADPDRYTGQVRLAEQVGPSSSRRY
jgi:YHS domain-containing protein